MIPTCFVGVDPGRYGHGVVALAESAPVQLREKIANSEEAIAELIARVVALAGGPGQALWIIEATAGDGAVLIGELLARGETVTALTPNEVAARRKGRRQAHKTDLIDAEICASIGRESHAALRRLAPVPETVAELRVLSRYQDALIRDRTRLINRLRYLLSQYWPEFLASRTFAALDGDAVTALLSTFPTPSMLRTQSALSWPASWPPSAIVVGRWSAPSNSWPRPRSADARRRQYMVAWWPRSPASWLRSSTGSASSTRRSATVS